MCQASDASSVCVEMILSAVSILFLLAPCRGASPVCDSRYCILLEGNEQTFSNIEDAQKTCTSRNKNSHVLEISNFEIFELLLNALSNNTSTWNHDVLINLVERISNKWTYIDEFTRTPELLPFVVSTSPSDANKNFMSLYKSDSHYEFQPKYGHEQLPVVCSRIMTEEDCSKENGSLFYSNRLCYLEIKGSFTWFRGQNECFLLNASMASFVHVDLNSTSLKQPQHWLAVTKSLWFWRHSEDYAQFSYWFLDMPSQNSTQDCVYFTSRDNNNRWFRKSCKGDFAIACMTDTQGLTSQTTEGDTTPGVTAASVLGVITFVTVAVTIVTTLVITRRK